MKFVYKVLSTTLFFFIISQQAKAHLMVAQHGTLNFVENEVFVVLSIPLTAFEGIDDDSDQKISMIEFNKHRSDIIQIVKQGVSLNADTKTHPLQDIMLSPVMPHHGHKQSITQLTVMGKFVLETQSQKLYFHSNLFGKNSSEKVLEITATREANSQKQVFTLSSEISTVALFSD